MKLTPLGAPSTALSLTPPSSAVPPSCSTVQFLNSLKFHHSSLASRYPRRRFSLSASASNSKSSGRDGNGDPLTKFEGGIEENGSKNNGDPLTKDAGGIEENGSKNNGDGAGDGGGGNGNGNGRPRLNLKWVDLLLDPDPDNVVAVGLTGVLAWASVQVLWQLFVISIAILLAALKYSFVAALLVFILITLL